MLRRGRDEGPAPEWLPERARKGIAIGRDDGEVTIDLHVVVEYGLNLAEVASTSAIASRTRWSA